jgi:hypothetical protein
MKRRHLAAGTDLTPEKYEATLAALRVNPNAAQAAKKAGVSRETARKIAHKAGIELTNGRPRRNRSELPKSVVRVSSEECAPG